MSSFTHPLIISNLYDFLWQDTKEEILKNGGDHTTAVTIDFGFDFVSVQKILMGTTVFQLPTFFIISSSVFCWFTGIKCKNENFYFWVNYLLNFFRSISFLLYPSD